MGDPTSLGSWALGKALDTVIEYVKASRKYYDNCDALDQLLHRIKPLLSDVISKRSTCKPELSSVDVWLMDLTLELDKASATLEKALASNPSSNAIFKKKKYSDRIRDITERIRKVKNDGEGLAILLEVRGIEDQTSSMRVQSPVVLQLQRLRRRSAYDERCTVKLEVADTFTQEFYVPGELLEPSKLENSWDEDQVVTLAGILEEGGDTHTQEFHVPGELLELFKLEKDQVVTFCGILEEGGIEVNNATKLRLTIQVDVADDWYFYVVFVYIAEGSHPELFFPEDALGSSNSLNRMGGRVFPDNRNYKDDPLNVRLIRSRIFPTDACEQVSLYLLIVRNRVEAGDPNGEITIQDVQNHLQSLGDSDIIVKNWVFDIRPPKF